jgi:hypothetical protein
MAKFQAVTGSQQQIYTASLESTDGTPDLAVSYASSGAFTAATTDILSDTAHGLSSSDIVWVTNSGGALPAGLAVTTNYWVDKIDANTFYLATSEANRAAGTYVDITGTGTGTHTWHKATKASWGPASGHVARVSRLIVHVRDGAGFTTETFGALSALDEGIQIGVFRGNNLLTLLTASESLSIKTNSDWAKFCFDILLRDFDAAPTNENLQARWSFFKHGQDIRLDGNSSDTIVALIMDADLSGLLDFNLTVEGYYESIPSGSVISSTGKV